jgi:hypothetical protein
MNAHFFDIDTILIENGRVWIVDKSNPNFPILKISKSDFNLIRSGIFKGYGNKIIFSGETYWLSEEIINLLKIKNKKTNSNLSNLSFSMQEFMNTEVIETLDFDINLENLLTVKNTSDDIYIICSKNSKRNYEIIIKKIESKMEDMGISVKDYYFISETFYNRNEDDISFKKVRLLLQHLIGLKTDGRKFTGEEITKYNYISFYDTTGQSIEDMKRANDHLHILLSESDSEIKSKIKADLKSNEHIILVNEVTENKFNKSIKTKVLVAYSNLIKAFESFRWK